MTSAAKRPPRIRAVKPTEDPDLVTIMWDLSDLTVGQVEDVEDLLEAPIAELWDPKKRQGRVLRAIAWAIRKDVDPTLTFEDARRFRVAIRVPEPVPPTNGSGSYAGSLSSTGSAQA